MPEGPVEFSGGPTAFLLVSVDQRHKSQYSIRWEAPLDVPACSNLAKGLARY